MKNNIIFQNDEKRVYSRSYFENTANILLQLAKRNQVSILLAIVNIDNMDSINDKYGHSIGDEIVELMTNAINDTSRKSDLVAYLGAHKIGIIFYNITQKVAEDKLKSISKIMAENIYNIETSIGGTVASSRISSGNFDVAYGQAVLAIEASQSKGSNCVTVY